MTVHFIEFPMASRPQAAPACFSREIKPGSVGQCCSWNLVTYKINVGQIESHEQGNEKFNGKDVSRLVNYTTSGLKLHHSLIIVAAVCDRRWANGTALIERRYSAISN